MENLRIPAHIAIILDGNGRWAAQRGLPRRLGHKAGCEALEQVVEDAVNLGIKVLSVYAFSTENWKRSAEEIGALMQLFRLYIPRLRRKAMANDVRVRVIGDTSRFEPDLIQGLEKLCEDTKAHQKMDFVFALGYGSRDELTRAVRKVAERVKSGELDPENITEEDIGGALDTAGLPDPDLLIRTSGEQRLSNFMLWQSAYTELYFPQLYWPDFDKNALIDAIEEYNRRDRRFGGRKESV